MGKARYIMLGGFLGAGKTTSIQKLAKRLSDKGLRVGLITNDQGTQLADTHIGKANGFPVEEIAGGCFCCRFNSLVDAAKNLTKDVTPDVFIAEPVGSCTDLVSTVSFPLQQIYGNAYSVAPLSVLVDPVRALCILGVEDRKKFSSNVLYIYKKQLEEADVIVINKVDLISEERLQLLQTALGQAYPNARVFVCSAREETGLEPWFDAIMEGQVDMSRFMSLDYDRYAEGEALLGWLNATVLIESELGISGNAFLETLASIVRDRMVLRDMEIAHLKMTLSPEDDPYGIGAVNLVQNDRKPELSHHLFEVVEAGELIVNIRAEGAPEMIEQAFQEGLEQVCKRFDETAFSVEHLEHFRPAKPEPTHRVTEIAGTKYN